jgi:hypothetical protein
MERAAARADAGTDALVARAYQAGVLRATAMDLTCSSGSSSATVLGPPYRRACSPATLREVALPCQQTVGKRCAECRSRRSPATVSGVAMRSPDPPQAQRGCQLPRPGKSQRGAYSQGCLRSKNSGTPMLSCCISSIWAFSSGGGSLRSPSRAAASEVKYIAMV